MDKKYNKIENFLVNLLYITIIFTLTKLIGDVISLELSFFSQLIIVIIIATIIKCFVKYPFILLLTIISGVLIMIILNTYKYSVFLSIIGRFSDIISNLTLNLQGKEIINGENSSIIYFLLVASVSAYTAIIIYRLKSIFLLIPMYVSIFLAYWYSFIDKSYNSTAIFLFLFLVLLGLNGYKKSKFKTDKTFKRWIRTTIIYGLIIVLGAFFIPKATNYIEFPWLQQKVYNTFPSIEDLRYYKDFNRQTSNAELFNFSRSSSEFSDVSSDLGGPLVQTEKKIMTVESKQPLYLRGNVKHTYTGRTWEKASDQLDEYSLRQDFSLLLPDEQMDFYTKEEATIIFDSFISRTIFTPYKPMRINSNRDFSIFEDRDNIVTTRDGIYKDEGYIIEFLKPLSYNKLLDTGIDKTKNELKDLEIYLQLPENRISNRTKELTESLVEGLENDYDKAVKIQDHLRENYDYNLNVDLLPGGEEFIDYFLFEEQEGYCTSYATSMTIMLRLEGIPSRYVEGYVVNEEISTGKYQVRQKHAHTWVEAFIEPIGWISFEPTAAYENLNQESPIDDIENGPVSEEDILPEKEEIPLNQAPEIEEDFETKKDTSDESNVESNNLLKNIRISILLIFIFLIILRVLYRNFKYKSKEKHLSVLDNRSKIIYLYKDILEILSILKFPLLSGETHFEHANRVSYKFTSLTEYGIKDIVSIFVKAKYSDLEVNDEDMLSVALYRDKLHQRLKNTIGKTNYFYRKYINIYFKKRKDIP